MSVFCGNVEHKKPCHRRDKCERCGLATCHHNFAYHICNPRNRLMNRNLRKQSDQE